MAKTVMHSFRMSEISAVDRPAQAHAKAAIMKRHVQKDMYQVSNFASLLCSIGSLMQSSEYEAQREGDGSMIPGKLKGWLRSGAEIFQSMAAEEIGEMLAAVNKAEEPYWKSKFTAEERDADAKSGAAESDGSYPIKDADDLHNAMQAYGRSKDKAKTKAHIRARAKALGMEDKLSDAFKRADGVIETIKRATTFLAESVASILTSKTADKGALLEKTFDQFSDHLGSEVTKALAAGSASTSEMELDMNPIKKALGLPDSATDAEVQAAIVKALAAAKEAGEAIAKMTIDLAIAKAAMGDDEKAYHDGLKDDDAKASFRSASKEDRKGKMAKRDELPEHIRKQLADADDMRKRLAALEDKDATESISKRLADIGIATEHVETVKKAYAGDKSAVDKLIDLVKAAYAQVKAAGLFKEVGDGRDNGGKGHSAYDELVTKADELRKKETSLTKEQAFAKVYADPANADLARRERSENRPSAA